MWAFLTGSYAVNIYTVIGIYLILTQGFTIVFGLGKLFNLAHISSYAIGAYTSTLLMREAGWGVIPALIAAIVLTSLFALLIGVISVRLESDYFAIGTLAFSSVVSSLLINWNSLTRGVMGIPGIARPVVFGVPFESNEAFLALVMGIAVVVLILSYFLINGSYGRALRAIGEFELGASSMGFDGGSLRLISVIFASGTAGVAGVLFSYYLSFIDPSSFSLTEMILVLTIVVVGRPGSFWGTICSTIGLNILPEALRFSDDIRNMDPYRFYGAEIIFLAIIAAMARWLPRMAPIVAAMAFLLLPLMMRFIPITSEVLGPLRQGMYAGILFLFVCLNRARLFPEERKI